LLILRLVKFIKEANIRGQAIENRHSNYDCIADVGNRRHRFVAGQGLKYIGFNAPYCIVCRLYNGYVGRMRWLLYRGGSRLRTRRKFRQLPVMSWLLSTTYYEYCLVGVPTYQITPPKLGAKVDHFAPIILFMLQSNYRTV